MTLLTRAPPIEQVDDLHVGPEPDGQTCPGWAEPELATGHASCSPTAAPPRSNSTGPPDQGDPAGGPCAGASAPPSGPAGTGPAGVVGAAVNVRGSRRPQLDQGPLTRPGPGGTARRGLTGRFGRRGTGAAGRCCSRPGTRRPRPEHQPRGERRGLVEQLPAQDWVGSATQRGASRGLVLFRLASLRTGRTRFRVPGSPATIA